MCIFTYEALFLKNSIKIERLENIIFIYLSGRCESYLANLIHEKRELFEKYLSEGCTDFVVDFKEVTHVSSTTLSVWIILKRLIEEKNGKISFSSISEEFLKIFDFINIKSTIQTFNTVEDAKIALISK